MSSTWIDISAAPNDPQTPHWPGVEPTAVSHRLRLDRGDPVDEATLTVCVHSGTHVDAPRHFLADGATTDDLDLEAMIGPCWIADVGGAATISAAILDAVLPGERAPDGGLQRVLIRSSNSARWNGRFDEGFVGLTPDGAQLLVDRGARLVGIDYLSVQPFRGDDAVHLKLLGANVIILEGLRLDAVAQGWHDLLCLPMKLRGLEGAPARALVKPRPTSSDDETRS